MRKERILIVEDEVVINLLLEEMLRNLSFSAIDIAQTFSEGNKLIHESKYDIVLMDINLGGGKDGVDLINGLSGLNKSTPIVYITGNSDFLTVTKAKYSNPVNILIKPVNETELMIQLELAFHKSATNEGQKTLEMALKNNPKLKSLSTRQLEVLKCIIDGDSNKMIATKVGLSTKTIDGHRSNIMKLLDAKNAADLVRKSVGF